MPEVIHEGVNMDIKEKIKEAALNHGMDMCGVAVIDRFDESPPGRLLESCLIVNLLSSSASGCSTALSRPTSEPMRTDGMT